MRRKGHFPAGNMGPKVESVLSFLRHGGKQAVITSFDQSGGGGPRRRREHALCLILRP